MIWVLLTIFALILVYTLKTGNSINLLQTKFEDEFASLNAEIVKRYDIIPQFVQEKQSNPAPDAKLVEHIIRARNLSMSAHQCVLSDPENSNNLRLLLGAESRLNHFLKKLQTASSDVREEGQVARSFLESSERYRQACCRFNSAVHAYNQAIDEFPASMVATLFSFQSGIPFDPGLPEKEPSPVTSQSPR